MKHSAFANGVGLPAVRWLKTWASVAAAGLLVGSLSAADGTPPAAGLPVLNLPPVVRIDGPAVITRGPKDTTTITATAADADGAVSLVSFILDGHRIWSDANPPYSTSIGTLTVGTHTLYAQAVDNHLATGVSAKIILQVVAGPELPEVALTTDDSTAAEADPTNILKFTLTRTGSAALPLQVYFQTGGTAKQDVDYNLIVDSEFTWCPLCARPTRPPLGNFVEFPAGVSRLQFGARALPDDLNEGTETVSVSLISPPDTRECVKCPPLPATYTIKPFATGWGTIVDAFVPPLQGQVRWIRPNEGQRFDAGVDLRLEVLASANRGFVDRVEFLANGIVVGKSVVACAACDLMFPPGMPLRHGLMWSNVVAGDYTLEAVGWVGANRLPPVARKIQVGPPLVLPTVTVTATRPTTSEPNPLARMIPVDFILQRTGPTNRAVRVRYSLSGTARNGRDYVFLDGDATMAAGAENRAIRLEPLSDRLKEPAETVVLTLRTDRDYRIGAAASATVTIEDVPPMEPTNPPPAVSIVFVQPKPDAHVLTAAEVPIQVTARDNAGYFSTVEFLADGVSLGVSQLNFFRAPDDGTPIEHTLVWKAPAVGLHKLMARGKSSRGAAASAEITVHVDSLPVDPPPIAHPADGLPSDFLLTAEEVGNYAAAWKLGAAWAIAPSPVPVSYVTRAGFLRSSGGAYRYDPMIATAPLYWVPGNPVKPVAGAAEVRAALLAADASAPADPAVNDLPAATPVNAVVAEITGISASTAGTLKLRVTLATDTKAWAVEETVGPGAVVTDVSEGGRWDVVAGVIRWGPFYDTLDRPLSAVVARDLPLRMTGVASFDGADQRIPHQLTPPPLPGGASGAPRIASARTLDSGAVQLLMVDDSAGGCDLEVSTDMVSWEKIGQMEAGAECTTHLDTDADETPMRFYRVVRHSP